MEIFNFNLVSYECDGCKKAFPLQVPISAKLPEIQSRLRDHHREQSPQCPRDNAQLADPRVPSFVDDPVVAQHFKEKVKHTLHFRMEWRDVDELDLTQQERKTPTLIIDPSQRKPYR